MYGRSPGSQLSAFSSPSSPPVWSNGCMSSIVCETFKRTQHSPPYTCSPSPSARFHRTPVTGTVPRPLEYARFPSPLPEAAVRLGVLFMQKCNPTLASLAHQAALDIARHIPPGEGGRVHSLIEGSPDLGHQAPGPDPRPRCREVSWPVSQESDSPIISSHLPTPQIFPPTRLPAAPERALTLSCHRIHDQPAPHPAPRPL